MSPLLMWIFPVMFLIPIVMTSEVFGGILLSRKWQVHHDDCLRLRRMLFFSALCLPIGLWVGSFIPVSLLKALTSLVVIFFTTYLLLKPHFQLSASHFLDGLTASFAGLLLGSCGIGGPPVALYLNATDTAFERTRSLLSQFISGISLFAVLAASLAGGGLSWIPYLLLAIPGYWLGMVMAGKLLTLHVISDLKIKRLCLLLLMVNAVFNLLLLLIS